MQETKSAAPPRSILCVTAGAGLQSSLAEGLSEYRITRVERALDAIRSFNVGVFDAYVLDYWVPDWSGVHLCREIRRTDPNTPICFYTSSGTEDQRKRALRAGADAYVCAPAGVEALRDELDRLLEAAARRSAAACAAAQSAAAAEIARHAGRSDGDTEHARRLAAESARRAAEAKARAAFIEAGGTPAEFERWWATKDAPQGALSAGFAAERASQVLGRAAESSYASGTGSTRGSSAGGG